MKKLELQNVSKFFPQVAEHDAEQAFFTALDSVNVSFYTAKTHTLLGENGAGKSTLVHILSGFHCHSKGNFFLNTKSVCFSTPLQAIDNGIAIVHQHPLLAESASVLENILCGIHSFKLITEKAKKEVQKIACEWDIDVDYRRKVASLSSSERFFTALLGALYRKPDFLILDEPTAVLDPELQLRFMEAVQRAKNNGLGVILITHKIHEAVKWSDTISVLRHGKIIFQTDGSSDSQTLSKYLNPIETSLPYLHSTSSTIEQKITCPADGRGVIFSAENICCKPVQRQELQNISFTAPPYGITGIFGLPGSGIEVLEDVLSGMIRIQEGCISLSHCELQTHTVFSKRSINPYNLRKAGVSFIPSRRTVRGSNPEITINRIVSAPLIALKRLEMRLKGVTPFTDAQSKIEEWVTMILSNEGFSLHPSRLGKTLSGGQLQRILLARELASKPRICILAEPEWGLDIKSTLLLRERLKTEAQNGMTILILTDSPDAMHGDGFYTTKYTLSQGVIHET